ncbi:MAG: hypothetical protein ACLQNE_41260 [Thermoguttaceae bacterium]
MDDVGSCGIACFNVGTTPLEKRFDGGLNQYDECENREYGPKGHEQAFDSGDDKAIHVVRVLGKVSSRDKHRYRKTPPEQNEGGGNGDEKPPQERRW